MTDNSLVDATGMCKTYAKPRCSTRSDSITQLLDCRDEYEICRHEDEIIDDGNQTMNPHSNSYSTPSKQKGKRAHSQQSIPCSILTHHIRSHSHCRLQVHKPSTWTTWIKLLTSPNQPGSPAGRYSVTVGME